MDTRKRIIAKTITFKILAMSVAFLLTLFFTGNKETAAFLAIANSITTLIGFYLHEKIWTKYKWQITDNKENIKRSLVKTITYKIWIFTVGTLTKWAVLGDFLMALHIGILKNLITSVIYFLHERIWQKISWGKL